MESRAEDDEEEADGPVVDWKRFVVDDSNGEDEEEVVEGMIILVLLIFLSFSVLIYCFVNKMF